MRILAPSIVDPETHRGGAGSVMRSLARTLSRTPLEARIEVLTPGRSQHLHRFQQAAALLRSVGSKLPAKAHFVRTKAFRRQVARRLGEEHFDLLLLQGSDLLWLLDELPTRPPTVLLAFNLEHEVMRSQIESLEIARPLRSALARDCAKLERFEERGLRAVDGTLCVSANDAQSFRLARPDLPVLHVPPLFDAPRATRAQRHSLQNGLEIGFLGNFEWWPNRAALGWFLREVFPNLPLDQRLHVFGEKSQSIECDSPRVLRHGFVPQIEDVWRCCDFMICPVSAGAGVNVKIAEMLYHRIPVLARPFATRGLILDADPALVTLDSAEEWIGFLRSPEAVELARRQVSRSISEHFASETHAVAVQSFVARIAGSRFEPRAARHQASEDTDPQASISSPVRLAPIATASVGSRS